MQIKVTQRREDDPDLARRRAARLRFLVDAQRSHGVTLQSVAMENKTHRSNLSTYINNEGQRSCISPDRLRRVLFSLGMHWDFTLRGQLHRWDLGPSADLLTALKRLLEPNAITQVRAMPTAGNREAFIAFTVDGRRAGDVTCLVRVQKPLFAAAWRYFGLASKQPVVKALVSDAVQSAWMAKDLKPARTDVRELLSGGQPRAEPIDDQIGPRVSAPETLLATG